MPRISGVWTAVVWGHAIQCMPQQEEVDIIIPIILDPTAQLTDKHMSAILIQVRNRSSLATAYPNGDKMKLFATTEIPYISIIFQLGMNDKGKESKHTCAHVANDQAIVVIPNSPLYTMTLHSRPTPKCGGQYRINICGCSSKSFGAINPNEDKLFKEMLTSQDIVECHPRQSEEHINAVVALKPYWKHSNSVPPRVDLTPTP